MKRKGILLFLPLLIFCLTASVSWAADDCTAVYSDGSVRFSLATGSPGELGLLEELAKAFNQKHGTSMCWRKAGSGKSLKLLNENKVDLVMVHAPAAEKQAVQKGWAIKRTLISSNEFYIVGPKGDPAGIANARSAAEACASPPAPPLHSPMRASSLTFWRQRKARRSSGITESRSTAKACTMMPLMPSNMTTEHPCKITKRSEI